MIINYCEYDDNNNNSKINKLIQKVYWNEILE